MEKNKQSGNSPNWRINNFQERIQYALKNSLFTDIAFEVGPSHTVFHAHKLVLASISTVFEAMFYGQLAETGKVVPIPDIMPDGFKILLQFAYTEKADCTNITEAFQTWFAAEKYCIPLLKMSCNLYFESCPLSASTVLDVLENALLAGIHLLKKRCLDVVSRTSHAVVTSPDFLEIQPSTLELVVSLDSLSVSEATLLAAVVAWARRRNDDGQPLKQVLLPYLKHIRMSVLKAQEFCAFLQRNGDIFEAAEALSILMHLVDPQTAAPPEWWCDKKCVRVCPPPVQSVSAKTRALESAFKRKRTFPR